MSNVGAFILKGHLWFHYKIKDATNVAPSVRAQCCKQQMEFDKGNVALYWRKEQLHKELVFFCFLGSFY